jgi:hypothetical protein
MDNDVSVIYDLGGVQNPDARRLLGCLITVGYELAAMSRADTPAGRTRRNQHHLILDEFAEYVAQSEEALTRMLALCRKYGLHLTLAHQTWSQASQRLRGALQNAGVEIVFKLGRSDAELTSRALGSIDLSQGGLRNQWGSWVQAIQALQPREVLVKTTYRPTQGVDVLPVRDAAVEDRELQRVLDTYAGLYQRPVDEIDGANNGPDRRHREEEPSGRERFRRMWR